MTVSIDGVLGAFWWKSAREIPRRERRQFGALPSGSPYLSLVAFALAPGGSAVLFATPPALTSPEDTGKILCVRRRGRGTGAPLGRPVGRRRGEAVHVNEE
jgi:hypothetical protein